MRSVAAIGRWSTRRPWRAIAAWLTFVALAVGAMIATGTESLESGAVGESARGYALIDEHQAYGPPREWGYVRSETLHAGDPAFDSAVADVAKRMRAGLQSDVAVRVSRDRHSAL